MTDPIYDLFISCDSPANPPKRIEVNECSGITCLTTSSEMDQAIMARIYDLEDQLEEEGQAS